MKTKKKIILIATSIFLMTSLIRCSDQGVVTKDEKPRIIVTADPELDDLNSMIRFLLHATDFRIEGLIYASSQFHWKGDGKGTLWYIPGREYERFNITSEPMESWRWAEGERFIHDAVEAYEASYANLKVHRPDYPSPEFLKSKIRYGNIEFDGDISKDSPGSELIKSVILDDIPGRLFITAWGGASTIARALLAIENEYKDTDRWEQIQKKVSAKVLLCLSGDQDDTYANYIKPNWPGIGSYQGGWGGVGLAYSAQARVEPQYAFYYEPEWMFENILSKGPLGALYRVWGDGKQMVKGDVLDYFGLSGYTADELRKMGYVVWLPPFPKGSWLGEGDTGTFINLLDNGLRAYKDDSWGGWGGRRRELPTGDAGMTYFFAPDTALPIEFVPAAQNELAARFNWSVTPKFEDANHHPVIKGPDKITASAGEKVTIKTKVSDPDNDEITLNWVQFKVGTYKGDITIDDPNSATASFVMPDDANSGDTIHLVLEAKDNGTPALYRYHRVVIGCEGN